jgi:hypothetical protein
MVSYKPIQYESVKEGAKMKIKFKNIDTEYAVKGTLTEQKVRTAEATGWMLITTIEGDFNSDNFDTIVTPDNICEIAVITPLNDAESTETTKTSYVRGYDKISSCVIRHKDTSSVLEIQLTKGL